jgi:hypothetical protein
MLSSLAILRGGLNAMEHWSMGADGTEYWSGGVME